MAPGFYAIATLYPAKGKTDELIEVASTLADYVKSSEPNTLGYEISRSLKPDAEGLEELVFIERYRDQEALKVHGSSDAFKTFVKTATEKKLFRKAYDLRIVKETAGFASRL